MNKANLFALAWMLVVFCGADVWSQDEKPNDILIIANKSVEVQAVSLAEVKSFFLKKKTHWKNGEKVVPINADSLSLLRQAFQSRVLEMNATKEEAYWLEQNVRKAIEQPVVFHNMVKAVFKLQGSIGYIFRKDLPSGVVKVLAVVPE